MGVSNEKIERIKIIKQRYEREWRAMELVTAIGIGATSSGATGIIVSVKSDLAKVREKIPERIEEIEIDVRETGEIRAL